MRAYRKSDEVYFADDVKEQNTFSWSRTRFPMVDELDVEMIASVAGFGEANEPLDGATRTAIR